MRTNLPKYKLIERRNFLVEELKRCSLSPYLREVYEELLRETEEDIKEIESYSN